MGTFNNDDKTGFLAAARDFNRGPEKKELWTPDDFSVQTQQDGMESLLVSAASFVASYCRPSLSVTFKWNLPSPCFHSGFLQWKTRKGQFQCGGGGQSADPGEILQSEC